MEVLVVIIVGLVVLTALDTERRERAQRVGGATRRSPRRVTPRRRDSRGSRPVWQGGASAQVAPGRAATLARWWWE